MDHVRILRTVLGVTVGYVIVLGLWLGWVHQHTPPGTEPYQIMALVGAFGSCVGIGMLLAQRPTRSDRRLLRHGLEGWATIERVHPLQYTDHHTELTELDLELTVPGSETYRGTVVFDVAPIDRPRMHVGETISIRVDPADRDRIMLCL
ncbi:hypothetical protein IRT45_29510 [Nocardia sp. BSTN01]|uniref:DUF3592 domain-containing protein n=1 Tax=Nocardia kruczakiae TaxID=261477 RepID=A0ABU1XDE6_9NOCA|nr:MULTISPECIES: hypothetical protein [Nocardia]MBF5001273.1 hypothetical protein [Nocardia sp. BSTN01]MDR7168086.1 hypothetical protein [Nocardia kruczakiae]PSR63114.1 hypothetical protein C8258_24040 [Nocardia sp. MDA0666]